LYYSGHGIFLNGLIYSSNIALNLTNILEDSYSLICLTPLMNCCKSDHNPNGKALGNWKFPNGSVVSSRIKGYNISRKEIYVYLYSTQLLGELLTSLSYYLQ